MYYANQAKNFHLKKDLEQIADIILPALFPYKLKPYADIRVLIRIRAGLEDIDPDQCWPWQGTVDKWGVPVLYMARESIRPARLLYRLAREDFPPNKVSKPTCGLRQCINPMHIAMLTQDEIVNSDVCKRGHVYPKGKKNGCPQCNYLRLKAWRDRNPEKNREYNRKNKKNQNKDKSHNWGEFNEKRRKK